jgi:hypothetical protein
MATPRLLGVFVSPALGRGRMGVRRWGSGRRKHCGRRYNRAMTPAPAPPTSVDDLLAGLPPGLSDADRARIAAAHAVARTASTRTVYGYAWRQWERWCTDRGIPALPGEPAALCAYLARTGRGGSRSPASTPPARPSATSTAVAAWPTRSPTSQCARSAPGCAVPTASHRTGRHGRSAWRSSGRSSATSTRPARSTSATPRSSCSATPVRCAAPSWSRSPSPTSSTRPPAAAHDPPIQDRSGSPRPGRRHRPRPAPRHGRDRPRWTPGSPSADASPARCSPASTPPGSTPIRSAEHHHPHAPRPGRGGRAAR